MRWLRRCRPESLAVRLLLAYLGAWLLASSVVGAAVAWFLRGDAMHWADHSAMGMARLLAAHTAVNAQGLPTAVTLPQEARWLAEASPLDFGYRIFDVGGRVVLWSSPEVERSWSEDLPPARPQSRHGTGVTDGIPMRLRTVALDGHGVPLWMEVGISERLIMLAHGGAASRTGEAVLATIFVSVLLLGGALYLVMRRLMKPVQLLSAQAVETQHRDNRRRLDEGDVPLELRPLVQSFNASLARQEEAFTRQLHFLADAAHELKTPLALLRFQVELGDTTRDALMQDIDHLSRQVQQLLILSEVSEPRSYRHEPIDVVAVAAEVTGLLRPMAARHGVTLDTQMTPGGLSVEGDRSALAVLLKNLAENAISVAPRGSRVLVALEPGQLRVRDQGPGIAPDHLEHIFERFWRAASRRDTGAGLGLAICREVAIAHGWELAARNNSAGAEFLLRFHTPPHSAEETP